MKHLLTAYLLPIIAIVLAVLAIVCSVAKAADIPTAAHQHRGDLTRIARQTFGLDAPVPVFAAQLHQESGWNPLPCRLLGQRHGAIYASNGAVVVQPQ
jgi:hypothetical protein